MRIRLLGTGTPTPSLRRMCSGYVVEVGEDVIVFDHGFGAHHRLMELGIPATLLLTPGSGAPPLPLLLARFSGGDFVSVMDHRGPEIPPSLRIRQKWTARKIAAASGNTMMWRT